MPNAGKTISELLIYSNEKLSAAKVDTPLLDSQILICHALGVSKTYIIAHPDQIVPDEKVNLILNWIERRSQREPVPYITGVKEFYGMNFTVASDVLIPRPETELLVDYAIKHLAGKNESFVADIGCGSGIIAICIAKLVPNSSVIATDISDKALEIASLNARKLGVDNISFYLGDLIKSLHKQKYDIILSNPPYIPTDELSNLQPDIINYEPHIALNGGFDGLKFYRKLTAVAPEHLKSSGILAVEIGIDQSNQVFEMFSGAGFTNIEILNDYSQIPRIISGRVG